ncbi:hypothetical protein AMS68_003366 [Peltaster fructicola]|uniref:Uncharacterized protein n=1 Tax=Peltaster fructicola TaxID=286661 RepID=A0A6H0XTA4_9PEZI|nr:hypothetical protein AMS68_003366 [Peltaster fructicola]
MAHVQTGSNDHLRQSARVQASSQQSTSAEQRTRSDDSWVEVASQPSSSSLSSIADEVLTSGLRVQHSGKANRRRRTLRPSEAAALNLLRREMSAESTSSQEEYEESESESDRVMTSSGEGVRPDQAHPSPRAAGEHNITESDDENRTAVNYPINTESCFTPQPNAFSHPPAHPRSVSQPTGSYFPTINRTQSNTLPRQQERSHVPRNILGASYNPTVHHEEALRASLSTLLSCAAAARGLKDNTRPQTSTIPRGNRVEPMTLRLVPESALPVSSPNLIQEPVFRPTLRRASTTTASTSSDKKESKRRSRPSSKERRAVKKARHVSSEELFSPTLLTWMVSAGVVVVLSALSFSAGYSLGREAGMLEAGAGLNAGDDVVLSCAREASRSGLGLKRSLARSAVQV